MAALAGRLSDMVHRVLGRAATWKTAPPEPPSLFDSLQQVLRVATQCPSGRAGDDIRRAACELVEADSSATRHMRRRRMLKAIARVEWRRSRGRSRLDDPSAATLTRLTDALRL
jgi:hypothetical protein